MLLLRVKKPWKTFFSFKKTSNIRVNSSPMNRGIKAKQSKGSHGSDHVSKPCAEKVCKKRKCTTKIVNQAEPVFCALEKKGKAVCEDAEMDPDIQHLIETLFWEIDNCPPKLTGEITL